MRSILILLGVLVTHLAAAGSQVHEKVLDNGLKVLMKPDHRAPIITSQVWYKVGSSYEHGGVTGISHVLEHMMFGMTFKGSKRLAPGEFSHIIAENGGDENAFTGRDYTAYYQILAKDRLEVAFELEAERMHNLTLPEEKFAKELEVVKEERRWRTEDAPESLTFEQFNATAYEASPYRIPIIGWADDLEHLQVGDLREWYRRWYAPNNATLVVVGDLEPERVFRLAEKHFGPVKPRQVLPPKPRGEPEQRGEKRIRVKVPAKELYLILGYKATALGHGGEPWEPYALEMLASVLDGGSSARFSRELVRGTRVAASAGADYSLFTRLPGMFLIDGTPAKGRTLKALERAFRAQVERVQRELVTVSELKRIRTQVVANKIYKQDSVFYKAMRLGLLESVALGWPLLEQYVEHLRRVTPEQIRAVARKYLVKDRLTVALLEPQPMDGKQPRSNTAGGHGYAH